MIFENRNIFSMPGIAALVSAISISACASSNNVQTTACPEGEKPHYEYTNNQTRQFSCRATTTAVQAGR